MRKCQCEHAGFCVTHRREMHELQVQECREKPGYFEVYNQGVEDRKLRGLGDTIEAITTATGIKKVVNWFSRKTNVDCGCSKRRDALNEAVPYKDSGPS